MQDKKEDRERDWPEIVLFIVGVGGAVALAVAAFAGLKLGDNPLAYSGLGAILTYVLTQSRLLRRRPADRERNANDKEAENGHD